MTQRVSGLVRELGFVKSQVLVKKGSLQQREIDSKKAGAQPLCKDLSYAVAAVAGLVKRQEEGHRRD